MPTHIYKPIDILGWIALALFTIAISRYSNIDLAVSSWFYDAGTSSFPLKDSLLFTRVFHDGTRKISTGLWLLCCFITWRSRRTEAFLGWLFIVVTALLTVTINGWFKRHSMHSCPWSLTEFGGSADYFRAFETLPAVPGPGRCLPSGHAAVGFMWIPLIYACALWRPQHLRNALLIIVPFALFCGGIQVARGAHLVTHVMWTAVICGLTTSLSFHAYQYRFYVGTVFLHISQRLQAETDR